MSTNVQVNMVTSVAEERGVRAYTLGQLNFGEIKDCVEIPVNDGFRKDDEIVATVGKGGNVNIK